MNQYKTDNKNFEKKTGDVDNKVQTTSSLVSSTVLNIKISEVENKLLTDSSNVTTCTLNTKVSAVENEIPDHAKCITTQEFNKLTAETFVATLRQAHLVNKTDFDNKVTRFNRKITSNKTKYLELKKS